MVALTSPPPHLAPHQTKKRTTTTHAGTELLFTWTPEDRLEVRLDNRLVETFSSATLAHELFLNYVNDDPISPQVKKACLRASVPVV